MCRNITTLRGLEPPATPEEIEAAARQYVRKISGVQKTSERTEAAFEEFVTIRDRLSQPFFEVTEAIASFDWDLEGVKGLHQMLNKAMKPEAEYLAALQDTLPGAEVTPTAWAA